MSGTFLAINQSGLAIKFRLAPLQCPGPPVLESRCSIGRGVTTGQRGAIKSILRNLLTHRRLELLADMVPLVAGSISFVAGSISFVARAVSGIRCLISQLACPVAPLPGPIARVTDTVTHVRCPVALVTDLVPLVTRAVPQVSCRVPSSPGPVPLVRHPIPLITGQISLIADLVTPVGNLVALLCGIPARIADQVARLQGWCRLARSVVLPIIRNTLRRGLDPHLSGPSALLGRLVALFVNTDALSVSEFAPPVHKVAFVTGLGTFPIRLVAQFRSRWSTTVTTIVAHEIGLLFLFRLDEERVTLVAGLDGLDSNCCPLIGMSKRFFAWRGVNNLTGRNVSTRSRRIRSHQHQGPSCPSILSRTIQPHPGTGKPIRLPGEGAFDDLRARALRHRLPQRCHFVCLNPFSLVDPMPMR